MPPSSSSLPPSPKKNWAFRPLDPKRAAHLADEFNLSPLAARLLSVRNLPDSAAIARFLSPDIATLHDPMEMRDMDIAIDRAALAIAKGQTIAVYGDYDVDGLTSTALLTRFFRWIGIEAATYIPHRFDEGYGMSRAGIDTLRDGGAQLIITVDNGISCHDEIAYAAEQGIDVIVTDHHQPETTLPGALAVVDPHRKDCSYPFKDLCGCGVAFKFAHALARRLAEDGHPKVTAESAKPFLVSLLDLVAMGTVADIMPLLDENRILVKFGLQTLAKTQKSGILALGNMLGVFGKLITAETIGFQFGPRLNAAGRTGNAEHALELLLTEDETRSWDLAKYLDELNQQRRVLENGVLTEALEILEDDPALLEDPLLVLAAQGWHQGVIGIVASRLVDRFGHPAIVLAIEEGKAKGSARSIEGLDLLASLTHCDSILAEYGGHKMAAGLSLPASDVETFRKEVNRHLRETIDLATLAPTLHIDTYADPSDLTFQMLDELDRFRPFGNSNPSPLIALKGCRLSESPFEISGKHLKLRIQKQASNSAPPPASAQSRKRRGGPDTLTAMWFYYPHPHHEILSAIKSADTLEIVGTPRINTWNNDKTVEFTIKDIRPEEA